MHPDRQPLFFFSCPRPNVGRLRWPGTTRAQPWSMVSIFIWDDLTSYWFRNFKNRFVPSQPHTSYFKRCFKYNRARVWNCKSHDLCSAVSFKAQVYWSNFGSFCQKFVISSVRQVRMVIFFLTIFCQALPIFKGAISFHLGAGQICV